MKKHYINKCRILTLLLVLVLTFLLFASQASAAMDISGMNGSDKTYDYGMDGFGNGGGAIGTDRNGVSNKDSSKSNLGDKDGDGYIEDKGGKDGLGKDIVDMGSEVVSDIADMGNRVANDIQNGANSGTADNTMTSSSPIMGIVLAVLVAIALVILIILFIPKNKERKR